VLSPGAGLGRSGAQWLPVGANDFAAAIEDSTIGEAHRLR
jgi:hypothetical protein